MTAITRGKLTVILAAMFLAGAAAGSFATVHHFQGKRPQQRPPFPPRGEDFNRGRTNSPTSFIVHRFADKLALTDTQKEQLKPVLELLQMESSLAFSNCFVQMDIALQKASLAAKPLLDEEQLKKLDDLNQNRGEFLERFGARRRGGGRPEKPADHGAGEKPGLPAAPAGK